MLVINIYYSGKNGAARSFAKAMEKTGLLELIRSEPGNLGYNYFYPVQDEETVLLIDKWVDQKALDAHHQSPLMGQIAELRDRFDLHMRVERYISIEDNPLDEGYIRH